MLKHKGGSEVANKLGIRKIQKQEFFKKRLNNCEALEWMEENVDVVNVPNLRIQ